MRTLGEGAEGLVAVVKGEKRGLECGHRGGVDRSLW